ncbi:glycoside hydrolase family 31 protein [Tessaracoccus antarcticus]|uniref:glycoside hydrolase family 31 protein n=1 Tax=Tessaracoccus antarcticus TaxID=2479848 RepID=UPI0018F6D415|nr:TIM-barrel domain-containing protein [Tessaracoccus antarcticus]
MNILESLVQPDGVVLKTSTGQLKVQAVGERVMRVVLTGKEEFPEDDSLMLVADLVRTAPQLTQTDGVVTLSTSRLQLHIDKVGGAFTWRDADGGLLVREPRDGAATKELSVVDVLHTVLDDDAEITTVRGADGERSVVRGTHTVVDRQAYATKVRLEFSDGEVIHGLGQHEDGVFNHRGHHQYLYQQNMKIVAPMLVSSRGWGMLWDSQSLMAFHDDQHGTHMWTAVDDALDFLMIVGPEIDDIVGEVRRLTGQAPMLPRWAMGYVQSKDRYSSSEELLEVTREFRRRNLPLDCIVQDWQTWPEGQWGQKCFDEDRYPDPAALVGELHDLDVKLMVSIWPNMHGDGENRRDFDEHHQLLGDGSTYDAFNPEARRRYWEQTRDGYAQFGVDAYWADCTEPFEADWKGAVEPEPWQRLEINTRELNRYIDPEQMNAYSLLHSRGLYEGHRADVPDKRALLLTRSGFVGQQRYSAITWSGDHSATWLTLRRQIADGLNLCITGTPYWTFDIGAYFVTPAPNPLWFWRGHFPEGVDDLGYRELYVRWLQMGAFIPLFRSHGRCTPREPWRFGDVGDIWYDTIAAFLRLRTRLLPYLYSLTGWTTQRGYTPMRALVFDFRHDPVALGVDDQFMLGPALLVCPVTHPIHHGPGSEPLVDAPASRSVYLPAGADWYDFWTGERHVGGQRIQAEAPLERIPLFVRSGTVLPLGPETSHMEEDPHGALEVRVYPGADGSFDLYEDDGDGYAYERGEFATTTLAWDDATSTLRVAQREGTFPGQAPTRRISVVRVGEGVGVGGGVAEAAGTLHWRGDCMEMQAPVRATDPPPASRR